MDNLNIEYKIKTVSEEKIYFHLEECNNNFNPPLDQKVNIIEYFKKIFDKFITFEAWVGQTLVGLVAGYFNDEENHSGYITSVSLSKDYMGRGVASALIKMYINYVKWHQFEEIKLEVAKNNIPAISLYRKYGFIDFEDKSDIMSMRFELSNRN